MHTTGTVTPLGKFTEVASLLISLSISTEIDKKAAVRITNTTDSPYLLKRNTQIAEFSVVTPEQSKCIRPVETAILGMIPKGDPDLTTYLSELLRTNKPEQQSKYFLVPDNQKEKEELNRKDDVESRMKTLERFDWRDTLPTEAEKHAFENILE